MGQLLARTGLLPYFDRDNGCDLNEEQIEEVRMITALPVHEIYRIRRKYLTITSSEAMSQDEFYALPAMTVNPLRDQVFRLFELTKDQRIPFIEFARFVAIYSYHSTPDAKLREAFRLHDFDGDGKISRGDLRQYLERTYQPQYDDDETPETNATRHRETIELVVSEVLEEAASDASAEALSYEDFVKVRGAVSRMQVATHSHGD